MKFNSVIPRPALTMARGLILLVLLAGLTGADQALGSTQTAQQPGFFQRASDNIGGFFHRLFNPNDTPPPPQPQHSGRGKSARPGGPRYNLDSPPSGVVPTKPATPSVKSGTNSSKTTSGKHSSGENEDQKSGKPKNTASTQEKKVPADKAHTAEKKSTPESKTPRHETTDTTAHTETKSTGKTETPTEEKSNPEQTVLTGSKTSKAGRVKSPYPPYNELDVSGLSTGSLALDPTTQKVFRVP